MNFGHRTAQRRRSSLAIELSVFIAKIISKYLYVYNKVSGGAWVANLAAVFLF